MNFSFQHLLSKTLDWLSPTGIASARTYRSPFARCILGLNRRYPASYVLIYYLTTVFDHCFALLRALHPENNGL